LIPSILAVLFVLAYLDLRKRVMLNQDTGTRSVQTLSRDFESKLSDLTTKYSELEAAYAKSNAAFEKTFSALKFRLQKTDYRVKQVNETMVGKKEHQAVLSQVDTIAAQLKTIDETFNQRMVDLTGSVKNSRIDLTKVKTEMGLKVDQQTLDQHLGTERKKWQQKMLALEKDINGQLKRIQQSLASMEKSLKAVETKRAVTPPPPALQQPGPSSPAKPEEIIEKDL
jgi:chromosome segregation ATPase